MKAAATKLLVLDASVALAWCFADEKAAYPEALLDLLADGKEAIVPAIWAFEMGNALLAGEKRRRISVAQVTSILARVAELPISIDPLRTDHAFQQILPLARQAHLTEYDAAYLELALRLHLPLATLDARLLQAAKTVGVPLFEL